MAQKPLSTCIIYYNIGDLLILEILVMRAYRNSWSLIEDSTPSYMLNYIKAVTMQYTFGKAILDGGSMNMEGSHLQKIVKTDLNSEISISVNTMTKVDNPQ